MRPHRQNGHTSSSTSSARRLSLMPSPTMLVTGGARGIGAGIAVAASAAGYRVAITYEKSRADADQLVADGHADVAIQSDAGNPHAVTETFGAVLDRYGQLDVLVNNA